MQQQVLSHTVPGESQHSKGLLYISLCRRRVSAHLQQVQARRYSSRLSACLMV